MADSEEQFANELNALLDELLVQFDSLRDDLAKNLPSFEKDLRSAISGIPEWLAIEPEQIRELFRPEESQTELGPRMVAEVALDVEMFVAEWVGDYDSAVRLDLTTETLAEYRDQCAAIETRLGETEDVAKTQSATLVKTLGDWLEQILDELQLERDEDERALADLVKDGSVDKGKPQLRENADVWEDYRRQAEELTNAWERLEQLGFSGVDRVVNGLDRLRTIVQRCDVGLALLYPQFAVEQQPLAVPERHEPEERQTLELDREPDPVSILASSESDRHTVELERVAGTIEADRPQATDFDASTTELVPESTEDQPDPTDEQSDVIEDAEPSKPAPSDREAFWAKRIVRKRDPIPSVEMGLVWGLPAVFFGVVIVAAIAHATGQDGAENPFEKYGWLWPTCVAFGIAMILLPIIRRWRVYGGSDSQGRARLVRFRDHEDESQVTMFEDCVKIGASMVREGEAELYRWEQFQPALTGWFLRIDEKIIACKETNVTRWEDSNRTQERLSDDAWMIPAVRFWEICEILNITK